MIICNQGYKQHQLLLLVVVLVVMVMFAVVVVMVVVIVMCYYYLLSLSKLHSKLVAEIMIVWSAIWKGLRVWEW